jgi:hypothetical protein
MNAVDIAGYEFYALLFAIVVNYRGGCVVTLDKNNDIFLMEIPRLLFKLFGVFWNWVRSRYNFARNVVI